jgi:hypothetical protein
MEDQEVKKEEKKTAKRKSKSVKKKNGVMKLTKLELAELDLNQARVDMQATVLQNLQMKEKLLSIDYSTQRDAIRRKQVETAQSMEQIKNEYNDTRRGIEKRLKVSLDQCTVRQDGVVIMVDEEGNPINFVGDENGG